MARLRVSFVRSRIMSAIFHVKWWQCLHTHTHTQPAPATAQQLTIRRKLNSKGREKNWSELMVAHHVLDYREQCKSHLFRWNENINASAIHSCIEVACKCHAKNIWQAVFLSVRKPRRKRVKNDLSLSSVRRTTPSTETSTEIMKQKWHTARAMEWTKKKMCMWDTRHTVLVVG